MVSTSLSQDHSHDCIFVCLAPGTVSCQCTLNRQVTDHVTANNNEVASDQVFAIKITHNITN
jgi:hypothetical protein